MLTFLTYLIAALALSSSILAVAIPSAITVEPYPSHRALPENINRQIVPRPTMGPANDF
ncbi:hypothetical protein K503DRAFT_774773 [Rhizopogon vinicolor AM-OR11-026]|uniref:Uncharacterized protein n=1 Tax=Rhizopogon vinicolor AM-OR11-026 TaxID=1314800 RepID=A0A1B7MNQ2_9AGAM|nr:hypothetical protein K503DRAFT_774773 [Rhizopogon vinicolor AM-OR11-026]